MKSKHILASGALTGMIALSTPVFAGPLGVITGTGMGAARIGGIANGALSHSLGAAALGSPSAAFGAAGGAGAMASGAADAANMGSIGAAANGHFAGNAKAAPSANPDALKPLAKDTLRAGGRVAGNAEERVPAAHGGASASGGAQASGGSDGSVDAEGSTNAHLRVSASPQ